MDEPAESDSDAGHPAGHLLYEKVYRKQRLQVAFTPAVHLPLGAEILDVGALREIQYNLISAGIEFLRKRSQWFRSPVCAIRRAPDGDIQTFLLNNASNTEGQNEGFGALTAQVQIGPGSCFANCGF